MTDTPRRALALDAAIRTGTAPAFVGGRGCSRCSMMARTGFAAPLGVFATEGDAGPSCLEVFGGTTVQCLVDASVAVRLPDGGSISITGLSGRRGRERSSAWLRGLRETAPRPATAS